MTSKSKLAFIERMIAKAQLDFEKEQASVNEMLAECAATHATPAASYWLRLERARNKVKILTLAYEAANV